MMSVGAPPAAGIHTRSDAAGPKNAPPASCNSRAAARVATMRSPFGDQARSDQRPADGVNCDTIGTDFFGFHVARMMRPPVASSHVTHAMDLESGDQTGPYSPPSFRLTRVGVPPGKSMT